MTTILGKTHEAQVSDNLAERLIEEGFGFVDQDSDDDEIILWEDSEEECFSWIESLVAARNEYG